MTIRESGKTSFFLEVKFLLRNKEYIHVGEVREFHRDNKYAFNNTNVVFY